MNSLLSRPDRFYRVPGPRILMLLLFAITLLVFMPSCFNGFIDAYDDELYVTMNPMVQKGLTLEGVRWAFTTLHAANWQPLAWLSHMIDVQLFGLRPFGHHLVSVIIHGASCVLLYTFMMRIGITTRIAFICSLIYAVHPQRVESVVWIAERKDVLSVFWGFLVLHVYIGYAQNRSRGCYALALLLFAFSLMSKPMLVTLPFVLLLMDFFTAVRSDVSTVRWMPIVEKVPFLFLSAGVAIVTVIAQRADNALGYMPFATRFMVAASGVVEYLRLFLFPVGLSFHYPLDNAWITAARCAFSLCVISLISVFIYRAKKRELAVFGWLWFLVSVFPVSGIIRYGGQFVADRYTYFPHVGLLVTVAWVGGKFLDRYPNHVRTIAVCVAMLLVAETGLTIRQAAYWKDGATLYRRAIRLNPENWLAHSNLGSVMLRNNRYGEAFLHMARSHMLRGNTEVALETLEMASREGAPVAEVNALRNEIAEVIGR